MLGLCCFEGLFSSCGAWLSTPGFHGSKEPEVLGPRAFEPGPALFSQEMSGQCCKVPSLRNPPFQAQSYYGAWTALKSLSHLPGASVRNSSCGKGHEEGGFGIRKGGIEPQETPCFRASTPKTRVCLLYCFTLSPTPLTFRGAVPHLSRRRS